MSKKQKIYTAEMEKEFLKKWQRTLPKKVSEVRLHEKEQKHISNHDDG